MSDLSQKAYWMGGGLIGLMILTVAIGPRTPLSGQARAVPEVAAATVGGAFGGGGGAVDRDEDVPRVVTVERPPMSLAATRVWLKMQEPIAFNFPNETPISDILSYVRQSTIEPKLFPRGLPIYLDPQALRDQDQTPASPVTLDLEGIPLATTLKLALGQLNLGFKIHDDGLIWVTTQDEVEATSDISQLSQQVDALRAEVRSLTRILAGSHLPTEKAEGAAASGKMGSMGGMM